MEKFNLVDRFRLELKWDKAIYEQDGICKLVDAKFSGPALTEAVKLNDNDFIMLDFFSQYLVLVENVYVAKFSWKEVTYKNDGSISLSGAYITHTSELNRVPKLKDTDYLMIDTSNHVMETHSFYLAYKTYVVNETTNLYKFGR